MPEEKKMVSDEPVEQNDVPEYPKINKKRRLTSVHIPADLYVKFKVLASYNSITLKDFVVESMKMFIRDKVFREKIVNKITVKD